MSTPYFFFRPLLAADRSWAAIDWRSGSSLATKGVDFELCFSESAASSLADLLPLVASISPSDLGQTAFVDSFNSRQVVFVLPAATLANTQALAQCEQLRAKGYRLGLRLDSAPLLRQVPVALFGFLQFEAAFVHQELSQFDLTFTNDAGFQKIATDVGSHEMFDWLSAKGVDWYDSHFLTTRVPLSLKEPDLGRLKLLKLLNLVSKDGDTREIEAIFREEPRLSYNLLRLVNSVAVGARVKISNFSQAITILGRRQLQRWLQLLIYANNLADGNVANPLMQLAAARGRQMELLSMAIEPKPSIPDLSDDAFLIGLFSLLEILINLPIGEILEELPMQDEVMEALISPRNGGVLGQLLSMIIASESGNFSTAEAILSSLGISPETHAKSQVTALHWACQINAENGD